MYKSTGILWPPLKPLLLWNFFAFAFKRVCLNLCMSMLPQVSGNTLVNFHTFYFTPKGYACSRRALLYT